MSATTSSPITSGSFSSGSFNFTITGPMSWYTKGGLLVVSGGQIGVDTGASQLVHGQPFTASGYSGGGTKSRGLAPLVADQGTAADGTLDSQWSGSEAGPGIGIANHTTPYTASGGTTMNAPHPYVSRIIAGDCNETNTGMCKNFDRPTGDYVIRSECYFRADPNWTFTSGSANNFKTYNLNGAYSPPLYVSSFYSYLNYDNGPYSNTDSTRQIVLDSVHDGSGGFDNPDLNGNNVFRGSGRSPWTPANGWIKSVTEWYCTSDDTGSTGGRVDMFENSNLATNLCLKSGSPYKGRTDAMPGTHRSFLFGGFQADRGPNAYRYWGDIRFDITAGGMSPGAHVAGVYVGDNANPLACTKLVWQIPTAFADGSSSFNFWKADLVGGTIGYVHVQPEQGAMFYTNVSATIAVSP